MDRINVVHQEDLGILSPQEIDLIWLIRTKYKYGKLTIETNNGVPVFIEQTIQRTKLG